MSALATALDDYLALRRGLGTKLREPAGLLRRFVEFADREGATVVTTELALRWARAPLAATPATHAARLGHVRRFARWLSATEPRTEVPPAGLLPARYRRRPPYVYRDSEVARLVAAAARLPSPTGLRGPTYATLFGLLAATGLRLSEALALDRDDIDIARGLLMVRHGKFGKARFVPVHPTTGRALQCYERQRDRHLPRRVSGAFFLSERGTRITEWSARYTFAVVSRTVGLRAPTRGGRHGRGPRLHDLRHHLAAATLVRWYREGRDVERELPKLSTYLGHAHVADTYWYIEAVPELLQLATERVTRSGEGRP